MKAQSRRRSADWNASRNRSTRKTGERRRRFSARRMTTSTRVARSRGKNPAATVPGGFRDAEGPGFLTLTGRAAPPAADRTPPSRIGNCESVASGSRPGGGGVSGNGGGPPPGAGSSGARRSRSGRPVTPELWTAASAADARTGGGGPFDAASSTPRKRSAAEISSGDGAQGAGPAGEAESLPAVP